MTAFRSIVFSAVLAGLIVGIFVTMAQRVGTVPLILRAEVYERQAKAASHQHATANLETPAGHEHETPTWEPAEGFERNAYTPLFNVVDWIGFGLLLNGASRVTWKPAMHRLCTSMATVSQGRPIGSRSRGSTRIRSMTHVAMDKAPWLALREVEADWPVQGKPRRIGVDNGGEFHSEAFERGCEQHGIAIDWRPPGQPQFGGVVERVIGTLMGLVHGLPGTTFSNVGQRGSYDSDKAACLTLEELERWLRSCGQILSPAPA